MGKILDEDRFSPETQTFDVVTTVQGQTASIQRQNHLYYHVSNLSRSRTQG
jgi:hypothetical protein